MRAKRISSSSELGLSRKATSPLLGAEAEMDEQGRVAAVVEDHVRQCRRRASRTGVAVKSQYSARLSPL